MTHNERLENFIKRARAAHAGENLDYSKVVYKNNKTPVIIIDHDLRPDGTEYGEYEQLPINHIKGMSHPEKAMRKFHKSRKKSWWDLVKLFNEVHKNENLEYPEQEYSTKASKIKIIDHDLRPDGTEYGEYWQDISSHLKGCGHPRKGIDRRAKILAERKHYTTEEFKEQCRKVWGNRYDLRNVEYTNKRGKISVICPEHGEFKISAENFRSGHGCPKCGNVHKYTTEEFIERCKEVHGDKYDYSKVEYKNAKTKVCIICPKHGEFMITPNKFISSGEGCYECGRQRIKEANSLTVGEFIEKAKKIHGEKYDYSKVEYKNNNTSVNIICPEHGLFRQKPQVHLIGCGCPKCVDNTSKYEDEICEIIEKNGFTVERNNRKIINGQELDIYIPEKSLAIEFDGIYWHSEKFGKGRTYHIEKLNKCNNLGIKLIHIFEDEWLEHKDIVVEKLLYSLKKYNVKKVWARNTEIKKIPMEESRMFLEKNHIQGYGSASLHYGAYTKDGELVGVMAFKKEIKSQDNWELVRYAVKIGYSVVGLGGKLFKRFIIEKKPRCVKSFADRRWTVDCENNLYTKIGFVLDKIEKPNYRYVDGKKRRHKFGFRKKKLHKKYGLPLTMTEKEMCDKLGFYRIWDCGLLKYVYTNPDYVPGNEEIE